MVLPFFRYTSWLLFFMMAAVAAKTQTNQSALNIIPLPVSIQEGKGVFQLSAGTRIISFNQKTDSLANMLLEMLQIPTGLPLIRTNQKNTGNHKNISLQLFNKSDNELGKEGYRLEVKLNSITISANKEAGLFYGIRTLMQLLPSDIEAPKKVNAVAWNIPVVSITDYPRFEWRGLMLDVSRHFFPKEFILKYIDQMSKYKLNVFHWHLTDDQGWRIQIKQLPELTNVGAWRVDRVGRPSRFEPPQPYEEKSYGGFYTQDDIKEVIAYAASKYVTVVPEIDLPGHSIALFASYPNLSCTKIKYPINVGSPYFNGTHEVCVAEDSIWLVLDIIFTELAALFPGKYLHIGGDEVQYQFWLNCAKDKKLMEQHGLKTGKELQAFFTKKLERLVNSKGKQILGWDEILDSDLAPGSAVMSWRNLKLESVAARRGHPVVMTPYTFAYLDYAQGDTIVEPPFFRKLRVSTVYQFEPVPDDLEPQYAQWILGGQGNLWTENLFTTRHVEYMTWPRAFALSEVFWSPKNKRHWVDFARRMEVQMRYLDAGEVNFSPAVFDAIITGYIDSSILPSNLSEPPIDTTFYPRFQGHFLNKALKVKLATEIPGLDIYYTFDSSNPDNYYTKYDGYPISIPKGALGNSEIRVVTYRNGKKIGRQINCKLSELAKRVE